MADGEYLAGSSACMLECMNFLASLDLLKPRDLVRVGRDNPASLVGLAKGGRLPKTPDVVLGGGEFSVRRSG
jgi:N-acetylglucosamine-6-phosphate deacetylase